MIYNEDIYPIKSLNFDISKLQLALSDALNKVLYKGKAVNCICLTRIPGDEDSNPRGIYWTRPTSSGEEERRESFVDELMYTEFHPELIDSYFYKVYKDLCKYNKIGRVRILKLLPRTTLSWHRDPEPRIHIPILTNPGSILVVDNFATNIPADGSAYFMNTRKYHTAINGGEEARVHIVATVLG
jgi:hypothetical protein